MQTRQEGNILLVYPNGTLNVEMASTFEKEMITLVDAYSDHHLLLNFKNIEYITSTVLRIITSFTKKLKRNGKMLKLCNVNPIVYRVFEITNIVDLVEVIETEEEALLTFDKK